MKKFLALLKKEIKELATLQMIAPLIVTIVMFMAVGKIVGGETEKMQANKQSVVLVDNDQSQISQLIGKTLEKNLKVETKSGEITQIVKSASDGKKAAVVVIPEGFEKSVKDLKPQKIKLYSLIRNFSYTGSKSYEVIASSIAMINEAVSDQLIAQNVTGDPKKIKNPVVMEDYVRIGDKQAKASPNEVMGFVSSQTTFIPIILFMVIIFAAQMIATTIATEKENKTLETLLTTPVSRKYIVTSKMAGAGLVALVSSIVYMFGFRSYMDGLSGGQASAAFSSVAAKLGLGFGSTDYVVLAISLFFGILAALAISLILGAFAEDVKSVAGLTSPLMILVAIPYFLTLFLDINSMSPAVKYLVYAIPFSHSFLTAPNLLLGNYMDIMYGIIYQFVFFAVFVWIATKIFSTDKIVTMKLNFSKKRS